VPLIFATLFGLLLFNILYFGNLKQAAANEQSKLLQLAVLNKDVSAGQKIDARILSLKDFDPGFLPENFIRKGKDLVGCKTLGPVPANYPLTPFMLTGKCSATTGADRRNK